ncbi:MAG: DUF4157 domain-containing protein [Saonia sp.]
MKKQFYLSDHTTISSQAPTALTEAGKDVMHHNELEATKKPSEIGFRNLPLQLKRTVGVTDDPMKKESDVLAQRIMRMPDKTFIQRKCTSCEEENEIQRKPLAPFIQKKGTMGATVASPSVSAGIASSKGKGSGLPKRTKSFMESRFGSNFSNVNIHTGKEAVQMSRELGAKAFTVGNDIYFNSGQYTPETSQGKHLLAHELTHTLQQSQRSGQKIQRQAAPRETTSESIRPILQGQAARSSNTGSPPAAIDRGVNPSICFPPTCTMVRAFRSSPPRSQNDLFAIADNFSQTLMLCMQGHAAASPASHAVDIHTAAVEELNRNVQDLKLWFSQESNTMTNRREFINRLAHLCQLTAKEVNVEFHFNVIFENPIGEPVWAQRLDGWDRIFEILSQLPEWTLWNLENTFRMRREDCHTDGGFCDTRIGGITEMDQNQVRIFNSGMRRNPFGRSTSLNLPGDYQTIIHEIGHVVDHGLSPSDRTHFFNSIMDWKDYPWHWINNPSGIDPTCDSSRTGLSRERCTICTDIQMLNADGTCNDTQLDTWLLSMTPGTSADLNGRKWWRPGGINQHHIQSVPIANLPTGIVFEYANTAKGEYFAELYALAILRPEFLDNALPQEQSAWLRRIVFQIPDHNTLQRMVSLPEPQQTQFLVRVQKLYTWEQINALIRFLLNSNVA